jgi:hypothetical protein
MRLNELPSLEADFAYAEKSKITKRFIMSERNSFERPKKNKINVYQISVDSYNEFSYEIKNIQ